MRGNTQQSKRKIEMKWLTKLFKTPVYWAVAQQLIKLMLQAESTGLRGSCKLLIVLDSVRDSVLVRLGIAGAYERLQPVFRAAIDAVIALINALKIERDRAGLS